MARSFDQTIIAPTLLPITKFLQAHVSISSPANNAKVSTSFTVTGTASCEGFRDDGAEIISEGDMTQSITAVDVRVGADTNPFQRATATGPSTKPWQSWSFAVNTTVQGSLTITARVTATRSGYTGDTGTFSRQVMTDTTPPTLTVNPPANVNKPAPPYTATITGTAADAGTGVAAVEWRLGSSGSFQTATGKTSWSASVTLPGLGTHTVSVRARDTAGNVSATKTATVKVIDTTAPALSITTPAQGETFTLNGNSLTVEVRGTASDTQTGVALVEWALDSQTQFTPAVPKAANDWSTWSAPIAIATAGNHTITVRAKDKVTPTANTTTQQRSIVVAQPFQPKDPEAVFSAAAYLDDLLDFATRRVKTAATGGVLITRQLLADTFLQPFDALVTANARAVAHQPVHQVRLCIEVLRRYLAKHGRSTPAAAETEYRQAAYAALLRALGTSHEEIRLARVADDASRAALASRLGIDLTQFRPDRLDELLLQPTQVTEAALERLFGLDNTTGDPLAVGVGSEPDLLIWRKEHMRALWQEQDEAMRSVVDTPLPVIDPDLLVEADLRHAVAGNAAYDLYTQRQQHLTAQLATMKAAREGQPSHITGFDRLVSDVLGPVEDLLALAEEYQGGDPIEPQLRTQQLTLQLFLHLMRLRKLALTETVMEAEWADVYAILMQVQKLRLSAAWHAEERQVNLTLGPDHFKTPDPGVSQAPIALPAWRATPQARQTWKSTLQARIQQEQALTQALQSVVDAAEEATLPVLRGALITAVAPNLNAAVVADRLTHELAIDFKSSGQQKTTRVHQALETLQGVIFSLRSGRFKNMPPVLGNTNPAANWVLALDPAKPYGEADFDEEWRWMGSYATWHAAILVFAYPDNYLMPDLRPAAGRTTAFHNLIAALRNQPRLTPTQARTLAVTYHQAVTVELGTTLPAALRHGSLVITDQLSDAQLIARRSFIQGFFSGITNPHLAPNYLKEIFYFVPMH